ncbi:hypothetical protein DLJ49_18920 [Rhodovulum sp. 12E13]|nr:hypothetical protein DLJ49_18920 [Rhodovulum sp. 12E13]
MRLAFLSGFGSIYYHGEENYPKYESSDLNDALYGITFDRMDEAAEMVDRAMDVIDAMPGNTDRISQLRTDLLCLKDWVEIYPFRTMASAENQE